MAAALYLTLIPNTRAVFKLLYFMFQFTTMHDVMAYVVFIFCSLNIVKEVLQMVQQVSVAFFICSVSLSFNWLTVLDVYLQFIEDVILSKSVVANKKKMR